MKVYACLVFIFLMAFSASSAFARSFPDQVSCEAYMHHAYYYPDTNDAVEFISTHKFKAQKMEDQTWYKGSLTLNTKEKFTVSFGPRKPNFCDENCLLQIKGTISNISTENEIPLGSSLAFGSNQLTLTVRAYNTNALEAAFEQSFDSVETWLKKGTYLGKSAVGFVDFKCSLPASKD